MKSDNSPQPNDKKKQRHHILLIVAIIFLLIGTVWFFYWLIWGRFQEYTDDAYVNGNIVQLMSQVPGTVTLITVQETQFVHQGDMLVQLDPADTEIALQRARAALAKTVRLVRQYFANEKRARALVILRKADLLLAQEDLTRRKGLVQDRAISKEEMQHYTTAEQAAKARYHAALKDWQSANALIENTHVYTHPLVEHAKAVFKSAYLNRQRISIVAPVTGFIGKRSVQLGQQITKTTPLLAIIPLDEVWVDANYKESQLDRLRIGQPVTLYADAFSDTTFRGKILGLSPGTGASFSLLPPQNATGNWIKIVQRLPVRVGLYADEIKKVPLMIGLSMRATTDTHNQDGPRLAQPSQLKPLYTTDVYRDQLKHVNIIIEQILRENSPNLFLPRAVERS